MPRLGLPDVGLDLVVVLALLGGLGVGRVPRRGVARRMRLDLGLLILALLVRHCSSFGISAPVRRCHFSRRGWEHESSHRPFKFASNPAIVGPVSGYRASLRAFGRVFQNPRVRNVQLAGVGSTLGTWAYAV